MVQSKPFTLVEVLVAALLLAIASVALISLIVFQIRFSDFLDRRRIVSQLATSRMEQLSQIAYDDLPLTEENNVPINGEGVPTGNGLYRRTTALTTDGKGTQVKVVVSFPGDSARLETEFELVSFRSD